MSNDIWPRNSMLFHLIVTGSLLTLRSAIISMVKYSDRIPQGVMKGAWKTLCKK